MPRSEAQRAADKKYRSKMKRFVVEVTEDDMNLITETKERFGLSNRQLIYCGIDYARHQKSLIPHAKKLYDKCTTFREVRALSGLTQMKFSEIFHIPRRTIQDWEAGANKISPYQLELIKYFLVHEGIINTKKTEEK